MTSANINESKRDVSIGVSQSNITDPKYTVYMKLNSSEAINATNNAVTVNGNLTANDIQTNSASLNYQSSELSTLTTNVSTLERTVASSLQREVDDLKNISPISVTVVDATPSSYSDYKIKIILNYDKQNNELYFSNNPSYKVDGVQYGVVSPFIVFRKQEYTDTLVPHAIADMISFNPQSGYVQPIEYYISNIDGFKHEFYYDAPLTWSASFDAQTDTITINTAVRASGSGESLGLAIAESVNIFQRPKSA